jgi:hypothetical protein
MKKIVLTDPAHDEPTRSLSFWIDGVVAHINGLKGVEAVRLKGEKASSEGFSDSIVEHDPCLVLFSGHGTEASLNGHNDEPLVWSHHHSTKLLNKRVVHALACKAGQKLGQELVELGAVAFIGYREDFQFHHMSDEGDDPIATLFLEPAYAVAKSLSAGDTTQQAHVKSQKMFASSIRRVLAVGGGKTNVAASLVHDLKNHVIMGDRQATI